LLFGVLVATVVLWRWKSPEWALGLLIGQWAHCLTDTMDTVGTMLFFPFTTQHYSGGMWAYAATAGRYGDAAAYYGSLGGVWDLLWLLIALASWRVFRKDYFETVVLPNDPRAWGWLRRRFRLQDSTLLAMYRAYFFYGACRIFAWSLWAWINGMKWDLSWGGPHNRMFDGHLIQVVSSSHTARDMLVHGLYGGAGVALVTWLVWRYYWRPRMPAPDSPSSMPAPERAPA
jgi:hypothetical protein